MALTNNPEALQDVMLAMDVVDTLRHADRLVDRELDSQGRRDRLIERLRQIYEAQGIEVTDAVLREGVLALEQERFAYKREGSGFSRFLAGIYIARSRWLKPLAFLLVVGGGAYGVTTAGQYLVSTGTARVVERSQQELYLEFKTLEAEVYSLADGGAYFNRIEAMVFEAKSALDRGDNGAAKLAIDDLRSFRDTLAAGYDLRVVNEPGERSGVFRIPDVNEAARNYYLIVEPVDRMGRAVSVDVTNEEDGKRYTVKRYGLRVTENVFNTIAGDKQDDGIIQNNLVGRKYPGSLEPEYLIETTGAAITRW